MNNLQKDQTIISEGDLSEGDLKVQTLREALSKFQDLNVKAVEDSDNKYFQSTYADLTSVINAVNHGAQFGLSFSQSVEYKNILKEVEVTRTDKNGISQKSKTTEIVRDIFVTTTIFHDVDKETISCCVPVLVNAPDKDNPHKMGSGITYAKRYGLQSLYGLASDDDGNEASKNTSGTVPNAPKSTDDKKEIF